MVGITIYTPIKQKFKTMKVSELKITEYQPYYATYISKVSNENTLIEGYKKGQTQVINFFKSIPENKLEYAYAAGKWCIKDVLQHIIDTERVFMYRCFRIARHDKTPLAGYNHDAYVVSSNGANKTLADLLEEYKAVRESFIALLKTLSSASLNHTGTADNHTISARAAAFIILGHEIHHVNIIKERYLNH